LWLLNALLGATAIVALGLLDGQPPRHSSLTIPLWALAAGFAAAELSVVHVHVRRRTHSLTLGDIPLVIGLVFSSPVDVALAWVIGSGLVLLAGRMAPVRLVFNLVNFATAGVVAAVVTDLVAGSHTGPALWAGAALGAMASSAVSALLIAAGVSITGDRVSRARAGGMVLMGVAVSAINASLGLSVASVLETDPRAAALLLVPAGALLIAYRVYTAQHRQRLDLEFLYQASRTLSHAQDSAAGLAGVLAMALDTFHAETAEVCLAPEGDDKPPSRVTVALEKGVEVLAPADPAAAEQARALVDGDRGVNVVQVADLRGPLGDGLRERGVREAMFASLSGDGQQVGTVMVADKLGVGSFDEHERRLFATLASHTGTALSQDHLERRVVALRASEDRLYHQAFHDPLTGLANRLLFLDRMTHALSRRTGNVAAMYLDLDDFKPINDTLGHDAGDALLRAVADRLRETLRAADTPARLGGDEFAVLLLDIPPADVVIVAERILRAFEPPVDLGGRQGRISASIGIAMADSGTATTEDLVRNADAAMYVSKRGGKRAYTIYGSEPATAPRGTALVKRPARAAA
jgi:diguanylate cyclase (GGDEF)-like protein